MYLNSIPDWESIPYLFLYSFGFDLCLGLAHIFRILTWPSLITIKTLANQTASLRRTLSVGFWFLAQLMNVPWVAVLCWALLGHYFFYGTGHQATFPNIHWDAAMVGTGGHFAGKHFLPATLVIINTFGSHIFVVSLKRTFCVFKIHRNFGRFHIPSLVLRLTRPGWWSETLNLT